MNNELCWSDPGSDRAFRSRRASILPRAPILCRPAPAILGPDDVVVEVHARFSRFLPLATTLEVEAEAFVDHNVVSSKAFPNPSRLFRNADMVFLEQREGDALLGLRAFVRLKSEEVSDRVVGRARLDVDGKDRYWVPKDKAMKEVTWDPNGWFSDDHYGRFRPRNGAVCWMLSRGRNRRRISPSSNTPAAPSRRCWPISWEQIRSRNSLMPLIPRRSRPSQAAKRLNSGDLPIALRNDDESVLWYEHGPV